MFFFFFFFSILLQLGISGTTYPFAWDAVAGGRGRLLLPSSWLVQEIPYPRLRNWLTDERVGVTWCSWSRPTLPIRYTTATRSRPSAVVSGLLVKDVAIFAVTSRETCNQSPSSHWRLEDGYSFAASRWCGTNPQLSTIKTNCHVHGPSGFALLPRKRTAHHTRCKGGGWRWEA